MKLQQQQFSHRNPFSFPLNNNLYFLSSFRFSSEHRCKSNPDKVCQNNGACHSKQESCHDHGTCSNKQTQSSNQSQEDPDITRLKELLNSFSKDNQQNHHHHHHEHGCCGGQKECGSNKMQNQDHQNHDHEHDHGCCGGHHHHHHDHHHEPNMTNTNQNQVQGNHNHEHEHGVDHHHHHHDGCCGHDHHHNHNSNAVDIEQLSKQKVEKQEYSLNSGEKVEAVLTGENTISYEIKGVKAREQEHGQLLMVFTCGVCETRSARTFTKKAYNEGVVLIRCEKCDSLHLVADNLGWFDDKKQNIETIMESKGEKVQKVDNSQAINDILSKFINKEDEQDDKIQNS